MNGRKWLVVAAVAFVVLGLLACGADRRMMRVVGGALVDAGSEDAAAQQPTCSHYEVLAWNASDDPACDPTAIFSGTSCALPPGWEPFSTSGSDVWLRRCVP